MSEPFGGCPAYESDAYALAQGLILGLVRARGLQNYCPEEIGILPRGRLEPTEIDIAA